MSSSSARTTSSAANQCHICHVEFPDENNLKIHQNQVHNVFYIQCKFCKQHFPDFFSCHRHEQQNHNNPNNVPLPYLETPQCWEPQLKINRENEVAAQDFSVQNFANNVPLETTQSWGPHPEPKINRENEIAQDFSVQNFTNTNVVNSSNSSKRTYAEMISIHNIDRSEFGSRGLEVSSSHEDSPNAQ